MFALRHLFSKSRAKPFSGRRRPRPAGMLLVESLSGEQLESRRMLANTSPPLAADVASPVSTIYSPLVETKPGVPSSLMVSAGIDQVNLVWTAPTTDGGSPITDYSIQYSSNGGTSWYTFRHTASGAVLATVTGLTRGSSYVFRVAAVNGMGVGDASIPSAAVVTLSTPGTPSGLAVIAGNGQASLSWTAPASTGGSAITDYAIQYNINGGSSWSTFSHTASASPSAVVSGLNNGVTYTFRVTAVNGVGPGSYNRLKSFRKLFLQSLRILLAKQEMQRFICLGRHPLQTVDPR